VNEQILKDQISQLQVDNEILRKQKEYFERLYYPCLRIINGRIAMNNSVVIEGIESIEKILRAENFN
jgi:hypothetical protein